MAVNTGTLFMWPCSDLEQLLPDVSMAEESNLCYIGDDWGDASLTGMELSASTSPKRVEAPVSIEAEISEVIDIDSDSEPEQDEGSVDKPDTIDESDIEDQGPDYEAYIQYVINAESGNDQYDIEGDSEAVQPFDFDPDTDSSNIQNNSTDYQTPRIDLSTQSNGNRKERVAWTTKSGKKLYMTKYYVDLASIPASQDPLPTTLAQLIEVKTDSLLVDSLTTSLSNITIEPNVCCTSNQKLLADRDNCTI